MATFRNLLIQACLHLFLDFQGMHTVMLTMTQHFNCKSNIRGSSYTGSVSTTRGGLSCQRWSAQAPHRHVVGDAMMADGSVMAAGNSCRSPDFDPGGPWCFTTEPDTEWDYCDVPTCNVTGCLDSPAGTGYMGAHAVTTSGFSCTPWSDVEEFSAYGYLRLDTVRFPDGQLNHNQCRNPLASKERPWCYSSNPDADWEFCDIPLCERQYDENQPAVLPNRKCEQQGGVCVGAGCCSDNYYVTGLCAAEGLVCCLSREDCSWNQNEELTWPRGSYALPMPGFGCAGGPAMEWQTGLTSLTLSLTGGATAAWSDIFHPAGPYAPSAVTLRFCERVEKLSPPSKTIWPAGQYCFYRASQQPCPKDFSLIDFVIELGASSSYTTIGWNRSCDLDEHCLSVSICCREDGQHNDVIQLPKAVPFLLLKMGRTCHDVAGMSSRMEELTVPLGDGTRYRYTGRPRDDLPLTFTGRNVTFNFCFYEDNAPEPCWYKMDRGLWYRGDVNMTSQGPCSSWSAISKIDHYKHYQHVGLDNTNYCRNTLLFNFKNQPWCYASGQKVLCGVPQCDGRYQRKYDVIARSHTQPSESRFEDLVVMGTGRAARQQYGTAAEAQLAVDGDPMTCSNQAEIKAWWQVDLQGIYSVAAIGISRQNVDLCVLRFINIYVGLNSDDFKTSGGLLCNRNVTIGSMGEATTRCVQPVRGQHVTIDNLVYLEFETYTDLYEKCFIMCEVTVYVKDTFCGRRLLEQTVANQIQPYMMDNTGVQRPAYLYGLHSPEAWCLKDSSTAPFLMLNLLYPRRIQAIVTQGNGAGDAMVTVFSFKFGFYETDLMYYQEYPGVTKMFQNDPSVVAPQTHHLLSDVTASLVLIQPVANLSSACLRFDVLGCIKEYDNLVRRGAVSQTSAIASGPTSYSTDNDVTTCSATRSEKDASWSLSLRDDISIHSVVMETGLMFAWNLAGGKDTYAITAGWSGYPWRATDGRFDATNYWEGSCSTTLMHDSPWWAVDMGQEFNVSTVIVTNRVDCCYNRLDKFLLLLGDSIPAKGEAINTTSFRLCASHDRYFGAGESHVVRCGDRDILGRYLVIVLPLKEYLTLCEVQVFGQREPFVVTVGAEPVPGWPGGGASTTCRAQNSVPVGGATHVFNCMGTQAGRHLSAAVRGLGPVSVCTALVYGGLRASVVTQSYDGEEYAHITCPAGTAIQLQWLESEAASDDTIGIMLSDLQVAMALCEGRRQCRLPALPTPALSQPAARGIVICSFSRTREEKCNVQLMSEDMIQTPNFPYYYGMDLSCEWVITAPKGYFVALDTSAFALAGVVSPIKDGCLEFNLGVCQDAAVVRYEEAGEEIAVETAALFVSNTNSLALRLKSCFRQSAGIRTGNYGIQAKVTFKECAGCSTQRLTTSTTCPGPCGHIISYGYPAMYKANERMVWSIKVDTDKFISLQFVGFDVYEQVLNACERDYVIVHDVNLVGEKTISHRFCNSNPPREAIISSWYQMVIEFISDATHDASGFHATYKQHTYEPEQQIPPIITSHPDCPPQWLWFESSCYNFEKSVNPLTWLDAEDRCQSVSDKGHLVSIANNVEMTFLHFMLTTRWRSNETSTFIGLTDRVEEGNWRWSDNSPITYTAWSPISDYSNLQQPDGAGVEDCAMVRLDSIHSTDSWHDIPCAYDQVKQYLCKIKTDSNKINGTSRVLIGPGAPVAMMQTVTCQNGEFLLAHLWCDGTPDCRDLSDERNCSKVMAGCLGTNFMCTDGSCVSMSVYCDFKQDCPDNTDESDCVKPNCTAGEFKCANGECISAALQCDLLVDCQDGTDEVNCLRCAEDVAFQCYDGTCISINKRCDAVVDCPGALHEDESEDCVVAAIQSSCLAWKLAGNTANAKYQINPGGEGVFEVECEMTSDPDHVTTILHHDSETRSYVTGYPNPGSYIHRVTYAASIQQVKAMKMKVDSCEQFVKLECYGAAGIADDFWIDVEGSRIPWVMSTESTCKCSLSAACEANRTRCWCEDSETSVPRLIVADKGLLSSFQHLPVVAVSLSGTSFKDQQYQYHTIGPLKCYQGGNATRDEIRCGSGQFIDRRHRCMFDRNARGDVLGCRDAANLENCATFKCPDDTFKCPDSFCIPLWMVCDAAQNCLNGEDELECTNFSCPGMYKCLGEEFCIEATQRCDGRRHCPRGDDELFCHVVCPAGCTCVGLTFLCPERGWREFPSELPSALRKLDATGNELSAPQQTNLTRFVLLAELLLAGNNIRVLEPFTFVHLLNLYKLDLSDNMLTTVRRDTFAGLGNLRILLLLGNAGLSAIESGAFGGLWKLPNLHLRNLSLGSQVEAEAFTGMPLLRTLDLSVNQLGSLPLRQFRGLERLQSLNASANPALSIRRAVLDDLVRLTFLQTDYFKHCCFVSNRIAEDHCLPKRDELSSCEDLMRRDVLKAFLWILGLMALLFNGFVLAYRACEKFTIYSFSVFNLAIADLFMGVYMVTLAIVDTFYRGVYIEYADEWTSSWLCQVLGFLNTLSSEASVFILCLISGDRFYNIVFPFKAMQTSRGGLGLSKYAMAAVWLASFLLAAIPLFPLDYFRGGYYSRSGMCISIYLTNEKTPGWEFSVFVFHVLNFFSFMFIFASYAYMYRVVVVSGRSSTGKVKANDAEVKLAQRMTLVVATDFLCWVPINMMGALALAGVRIPGEVYAWVVVFLLPVNSAINPLLYTITALKKSKAKKTESKAKETSTKISQLFYVHSANCNYTLKEHLGLQTKLSINEALLLIKSIAQVVVDTHIQQRVIGILEAHTIVLFKTERELKVGLQIIQQPANSKGSREEDVGALGKVFANILRRCAKN